MTNALALRMLARDWRAGELRVLALALVLAVAAVTSVGFFADRIRLALTRDAHQLLGGDVLLIADHPWSAGMRGEIARRGLAQAETQTFVSMARSGDSAQLSGVKAVSERFPLRGSLRTAPALNAPDAPTRSVPEPGTAWVDERMAVALSLKPGDTVELGAARFRVSAILTLEPDRSPSFINIAPRLMIRSGDLAGTGLVQEGSRVQYALLAAGERDAVRDFEAWATPRLGRGERLESLENARPEVRSSLERGERFVGLTALLAVILAAVAVSLSTRRYTGRHLDGYAVMRCFGATQGRLLKLCALEFAWLGLAASAAGCLAGFGAQHVIAAFVGNLIGTALPPPSPLPALQGFVTGMALLLGFAMPPLLQLRNVPALRVLRRDVGPPQQGAVFAWGLGVAVIAALLVWQARDLKLGLVVVGGFAGAFALFALLSYVALKLLGRAVAALHGGRGIGWRYGLARLERHARASTLQILALALGLTAVLMLTFTRDDLLATWQASVPPDAPNRFIVNIQPDQRDALLQAFGEEKLAAPPMYPMVRGRFTAHNGKPVEAEDYEERNRRLVDREFNLSYASVVPPGNRVAGGRWFTDEDIRNGALSVEADVARRLGWKLGDTLTWQVAGETFTAPIVNIRQLAWDSMRVSFFVIATPGLLQGAPTSYVTSFHLPDAQARFTTSVTQRFPNLSVIDTAALLRQMKSILDQVVRAVQFVFLFALAAGIVVLYAALLATQDERMHEAALMRALGASRAQLLAAQRAEFLVLGLIAGVLAAAGAVAIGWAVAEFVFHFSYRVNPWVWAAGPAAGLVCVGVNAWIGARRALNFPPLLALREAT
jgi:putative ABC transport system permease protein